MQVALGGGQQLFDGSVVSPMSFSYERRPIHHRVITRYRPTGKKSF